MHKKIKLIYDQWGYNATGLLIRGSNAQKKGHSKKE